MLMKRAGCFCGDGFTWTDFLLGGTWQVWRWLEEVFMLSCAKPSLACRC